jgi:Mn2+/Fe2+ NRAMP family transporter
LNINPLKALFYTAVINGVLAPFLLIGILVAASDRKLMQGQPSSWPSRILVGITIW